MSNSHAHVLRFNGKALKAACSEIKFLRRFGNNRRDILIAFHFYIMLHYLTIRWESILSHTPTPFINSPHVRTADRFFIISASNAGSELFISPNSSAEAKTMISSVSGGFPTNQYEYNRYRGIFSVRGSFVINSNRLSQRFLFCAGNSFHNLRAKL